MNKSIDVNVTENSQDEVLQVLPNIATGTDSPSSDQEHLWQLFKTENQNIQQREFVNNAQDYEYNHPVIIKPVEYESNLEMISVFEKVNWLETCRKECYFDREIKEDWIKIGKRKLNIENEDSFCNPELLQKVLKAKHVFDELNPLQLYKARSRANPFETVKSAFFMNRAALKMSNIDAATDFLFSNVDRQVEHKQSGRPYYFADICAGPGGFSEYILWRKQWAFKGFGFTLKGEQDFKLHESTCAPCETFEPFYGVLDNGDIYYPDNIKDFCSKVKQQTNGQGVHFITADGGFSVEGQENLQEVLSQQIYVCQCFIALTALRTNGHFVVKLFDLFTSFSVGLMFLMYHAFQNVAIFKPNASRPANSERYLICSFLKTQEHIQYIRNYLNKIVDILYHLRNSPDNDNNDINEIVPEHIIKMDENFLNYITESNNRLARRQLIGLEKLTTFYHDPAIVEPRQEQLRIQCLSFWQIPDKPKIPLPYITSDDLIASSTCYSDFMFSSVREIKNSEKLNDILKEKQKWHCGFVSSSRKTNLCNIYVGLGRNRVYRFQKGRWVRTKNIELVRGSIIFAELVKENHSDCKCAQFHKSLHVIDALRLGDTILADLPYNERMELISVYCQAINKDSRRDLCNIRCKKMLELTQISEKSLPTLDENSKWIYSLSDLNDPNIVYKYVSNSILFLKTDSSQTFNSTIAFRLVLHLPTDTEDENNKNSDYLLCYFISNINNINVSS